VRRTAWDCVSWWKAGRDSVRDRRRKGRKVKKRTVSFKNRNTNSRETKEEGRKGPRRQHRETLKNFTIEFVPLRLE